MKKNALIFGLLALLLCAGYILYERRDRELSIAPPETANSSELEIQPSTIAVNVRVPFNRLSAQANSSAPNNYSDSGNGEDYCERILGTKVCAGTQYEYTINRGNISISPGPNNTIHVSVPVSISGKGGFRGDGCKLLKCDAKNFRASVEAYSNIALSMGSDWCPKASVSSNFRWIQGAEVEIVGGIWIGISGLVEDNLRSQLQKMGDAVASEIKCSDVKREVEKTWVSYSVPVNIPDHNDALFINVKPEDLGFTGLIISPNSTDFALSLGAKVDISNKPIESETLRIPPLKAIPFANSSLNFSVPIHMTYVDIQEKMTTQIANNPISTDTPVGVATVIPRKLRIYPSDDALVIGALVDINLPNEWLDVSGWVYLKTLPKSSANGTVLKLDNPTFSRVLNNELWSVVSVVLENTIKKELETRGEFDLTAPILKAKDMIAAEIAKPRDGVTLNVGNPHIRLGRVGVSTDRLFVEGLFTSSADINLKAF